MKRVLGILVVLAAVLPPAAPALAETTLEKIGRTGTLTIGTRRGSPPFGFVNNDNQWVGFSIDLVSQAVLPALARKVGKPVKLEMKESTPAARIPLLTSHAVDLIAETMTHTRGGDESVDFTLTYFVTGAQFLVKRGSPIKGLQDIAGKRVAAQQGGTNARIIRAQVPGAQLREFPDQPAAFQALAQGQVDAYTNDGIQLAALKAKAPKPDDWEIVGDFYAYEPYGMAMRQDESGFRDVVNAGLMEAIESGKYLQIYEKWFGPAGEVPYPLTPENRRFLMMQVVPR